MMKFFIITIIPIMFAGCFGSGGSGGSSRSSNENNNTNEPYSPSAPISYNADIYLKQGIPEDFDGKALFSGDPDFSGLSFSLSNKPSWLEIDASTGVISAQPGEHGLYDAIRINANIGDLPRHTVEFDLAVNGDPLRKYAWHLNNTGQSSFSNKSGDAGVDINVDEVYARGITGDGIKVAVSDKGVEINHDDLYPNSLAGEHKDYTLSSPYYGTPTASDFHGTAVASLIAGKGWNNEGSMGVAPNASFAGFQFLDSSQSTSILINQASGDFEIFNYSYGDYLNRDTLSDATYLDHIRSRAQSGRGGKGAFFVKASGNEFYGRGKEGCFSHNANAPFENESPYLIVVGAVDAKGHRASYSNAGSNIWISAPGGEDGRADGPAIMAADLPTCFKGASKASSSPWNEFEYGHPLNTKCNYTSRMNGTSSAAPILSGVIALILEANPDLSVREVKHILASSAAQTDLSGDGAWPYLEHPSAGLSRCVDYSHPDTDYVYEQGWVTNKAGYKFHNYYGFGLVDADAAVALAQGSYKVMPPLIETNPDFDISAYENSADMAIPDGDKDGVTSVVQVNSGSELDANFQVESVQVKVEVSHPFSGEVGVELSSPGGTKSILLNVNNSFSDCDANDCRFDSDLNIVLASHAFYGEDAIGNWTLRLIDGSDNYTGTLKGWSLNILGHNPDA